ncbi:MAG TPA: hypothetical protein PLW77_00910 [Bacteroidales bacterium]|nr:hypothetical protein [Bacteroidales bacterium]
MKKQDLIFILAIIIFFLPFFVFDEVYNFYNDFNNKYSLIMAFIKFAILATLGEAIGLRIKTGVYNQKGFGLLPRAIAWGFFGMWIAIAMGVFRHGIPAFLDKFSIFNGIAFAMYGDFTALKLVGAFFISLMMNTTFAPVFMTLHKITDTHIMNNGGKVSAFLKPIPIKKIITNLNWEVQWGFVFKKTIPLFWIPAHTITFILPQNYQVLTAALLGVVLGVLLSIAAIQGNKK